MVWVQLDGARAELEPVLIENRIAFNRVSPNTIQVPPEDFAMALELLRAAAVTEMEASRIGQATGWEPTGGVTASLTEAAMAEAVEAISQMSAAPAEGGGDASVSPPPPPPPPENRVLRIEWPRYAYRGNRDPWCRALNVWALQRNVRLELFSSRQNPVRSAELDFDGSYGVVIYGTSREGDIRQPGIVPPTALNLGNRNYALLAEQRSFVLPNPAHEGVISDHSGIPIAQVIGRTVWILFRMQASASERTFATMRHILDNAWPMFQEPVRQVAYEEPVSLELVASQYATFRKQSAQSEAASMRTELLTYERDLRDLGEQIFALERRRVATGASLQAMEQLSLANGHGAAVEFDYLLKIPGVKRIGVEADTLVIYTAPIDIGGTPIGSFSVRVTARGVVTIKNLTNPKTVDGKRIDHPHVSAGEPCWGNIQNGISQMLGRGQYPEAVQVIMSYLATCNERDVYGRRISLWRTA